LDLSRFSAAAGARLSYFSFEATGLFQPSAECRRRGLQNPFMQSKIAISACRLVSHECRQISSAVMDLKKVPTAAVSWQFPLPLIDTLNPWFRRIL
jgi:hypothetical protein